MDTNVEIEEKPGYLKATVTGKNSREAVGAYLKQVREECQRHNCYRILIDEQLEGPRLSTMEVFSIASQGSIDALGVFEAIAYVDAEMGNMGEFAETVAINRGMPVAIFDNVENAERWLLERQPDTDEKDIFLAPGDQG
jgi:hypothetical protein